MKSGFLLTLLFCIGTSLIAQVDYVKRVNCGSTVAATYSGHAFDADLSLPGDMTFDGENAYTSSYITLNQPFKSARYTDNPQMHYRFDVANGNYRVLLHFVEVYHGIAPNTNPNTRVFDVDIEGQYAETDLNPISAAGGPDQIYTIDRTITVQDGELTITFTKVNNDPIINAIEIFGVSTGSPADNPWTQTTTGIHYDVGSVGIGTTSDMIGFKLAVDGNIRTREIRVDQDSWPDYVFKEDYQLRTLDEIKQYIEENDHLPNIPSAKEVEANGMELGKMDRLLLENVEELTLFAIQMNENYRELLLVNEELREEINILKKQSDEKL